jgi:hypothetical protein
MFACKQPARYIDYTTRDGADTSPIVLDTDTGAYVPFVNNFKYLGALFSEDMDDLIEVNARILKVSRIFGMYRKMIFCNTKVHRAAKALLYNALCTTTALYGCESWSVKANMERRLLSQQTQHCSIMLGVSLRNRIQYRITADAMRKSLGLRNVLTTMRILQLGWLGSIVRMGTSRRPRQLLTSWLNGSRLTNYNKTYAGTALKALHSVGISEDEWMHLAEKQIEWKHYITQTVEDRERLCATYNVNDNNIVDYIDPGLPEMMCIKRRRSEFLPSGGKFDTSSRPRHTNTLDNHKDLRSICPANCWDPNIARPRYTSRSPEAQHAQMVMEIGIGADAEARTSFSGLHYMRRKWEIKNPNHQYSWMEDADPTKFESSSCGPSEGHIQPHNHQPTFLTYSGQQLDWPGNDVWAPDIPSHQPITPPQLCLRNDII